MPDTAISESRWLIQIAGITGNWATLTGGEATVEHTKDHDGGSLVPRVFQGLPNVGDITVGRTYQVPRDAQLARDLRAAIASGRRWSTTVTARPLDETMQTVDAPQTYEVVLQRVNAPESNANSSQPSRIELVFTTIAVR